MHNEFKRLDKPHKIMKNLIRAIIGLCPSREMDALKAVKNEIIKNESGSKFDKREMTINDILEHDIKFTSMMIIYKIYYSNKENFIFETAIDVISKMMRKKKL